MMVFTFINILTYYVFVIVAMYTNSTYKENIVLFFFFICYFFIVITRYIFYSYFIRMYLYTMMK